MTTQRFAERVKPALPDSTKITVEAQQAMIDAFTESLRDISSNNTYNDYEGTQHARGHVARFAKDFSKAVLGDEPTLRRLSDYGFIDADIETSHDEKGESYFSKAPKTLGELRARLKEVEQRVPETFSYTVRYPFEEESGEIKKTWDQRDYNNPLLKDKIDALKGALAKAESVLEQDRLQASGRGA